VSAKAASSEQKRQRAERQQYALLFVALQDLLQARTFAVYLMNEGWHHEPWESPLTNVQQSAFTTALVMSYQRPFTETRSWPNFPGSLLDYTPAERALHNRLHVLRNAVYAHSNAEARVLQPIKVGNVPSAIEAYPAMRLVKDDCAALLQMIDKTTAAIKVRLQTLIDPVIKSSDSNS
jgi:hypothetical protein